MEIAIIVGIVVVVVIALAVWLVSTTPQETYSVIERMGAFSRIKGPGACIRVKGFEKVRRVPLASESLDVSECVLTSDGIPVYVDGHLEVEVDTGDADDVYHSGVYRAAYAPADWKQRLLSRMKTTMSETVAEADARTIVEDRAVFAHMVASDVTDELAAPAASLGRVIVESETNFRVNVEDEKFVSELRRTATEREEAIRADIAVKQAKAVAEYDQVTRDNEKANVEHELELESKRRMQLIDDVNLALSGLAKDSELTNSQSIDFIKSAWLAGGFGDQAE